MRTMLLFHPAILAIPIAFGSWQLAAIRHDALYALRAEIVDAAIGTVREVALAIVAESIDEARRGRITPLKRGSI